MLKHLTLPLSLVVATVASAQELSVNAFRNPSIGAEYRFRHVSAHAGYYPTNFESGVTTTFVRAGVSVWFLARGDKAVPSAFYVSGSYLRGLSRDYEAQNGVIADVGYRWMVWRGLNLRLGAAMLLAKGHEPRFNPTPGIGYAFPLSRTR
jgi:hypothetical protein